MAKFAGATSAIAPKPNLYLTPPGQRSKLKSNFSERLSEPPPTSKWKPTFWPSSNSAGSSSNSNSPLKPLSLSSESSNSSSTEIDLAKLSLSAPSVAAPIDFQPEEAANRGIKYEDQSNTVTNQLDLSACDLKPSLAAIRPFVKPFQQPFETKSLVLWGVHNDFKPVVVDKKPSVANLRELSIVEELEQFCVSESKIMSFPEYFSEDDKDLVKATAEKLSLGVQFGEKRMAVFKTGLSNKPTNGVRRDSSNEVFVDVSELARQGKDGFIAKLRLRRLNSGSGLRRNMLWDVAQSSTNGYANPVNEGEGGVYAVQSSSGQKVAMFKPTEEERFVREGLFPGEGAVREEAAYVLDSRMHGFSGVPPTAVARLQLPRLETAKQGAVQRFMASTNGSMEGYGMPYDLSKAAAFVSVEQVHRIGLLDVRVFNTDRHPGNILLIGDKAPFTMVPIDHGCILPSWYHLAEARFDWIEYPQCKVPFSPSSLAHIEAIDAEADATALRQLGIREECIVTMKLCVSFLKTAARNNKSLHWIGSFMQRDGCFENPSKLESIILKACEELGIPFEFISNEFHEQKGSIPLGILSRRPPSIFYDVLDRLFEEACCLP